jgi:hypothetical protein
MNHLLTGIVLAVLIMGLGWWLARSRLRIQAPMVRRLERQSRAAEALERTQYNAIAQARGLPHYPAPRPLLYKIERKK